MKPGGVTSARRDQGREPTAPGGTVGDPRGAAGGVCAAEVILDAAIGTQGQAVGGDQRPEHVADEPLERGAITRVERTRPDVDGSRPELTDRDDCKAT